MFFEQGYEQASVNDVVGRAGGSLATLYAQFGNKEGLFLAVAQDQHERFVQSITPDCVDHLKLEDGLQAIGERYLKALLARDNLAFFRIIVGEGRKFPQLLQRYIATGADKVRAVVADYLKSHPAQIENPEAVAPYFLELMRGRHQYRALADETYALSDKELSEHVRTGVRFFLNGALRRKV
ncbi:MAG: TetR/AcrR family transcriptional regulator [Proteobacteria bacterium]|nr:TetR/AcrR family transcriptional regulator [Pseudomonadota bacterium]